MNPNHLEKLHSLHLTMALEVKRICEANNIPYFILAGTLLGAVRHKGFIPWDDDLDIGMLRVDYDKFVQIAPQQINSSFFLQNWDTEDRFPFPFSKLRVKDTLMIEKNNVHALGHKGIFIDIFPLDDVPLLVADQRKHRQLNFIINRILLKKCNYVLEEDSSFTKKIAYSLIKFVSFFIPYSFLKKTYRSICVRYRNPNATAVVNLGGAYSYAKETRQRSWLVSTVQLPFEDTTLSAGVGYIEELVHLYNDYMTPPPENKRYNRHGIVTLDFGSGPEELE